MRSSLTMKGNLHVADNTLWTQPSVTLKVHAIIYRKSPGRSKESSPGQPSTASHQPSSPQEQPTESTSAGLYR